MTNKELIAFISRQRKMNLLMQPQWLNDGPIWAEVEKRVIELVALDTQEKQEKEHDKARVD